MSSRASSLRPGLEGSKIGPGQVTKKPFFWVDDGYDTEAWPTARMVTFKPRDRFSGTWNVQVRSILGARCQGGGSPRQN